MPEFVVNGLLQKKGKVYRPGQVIELTKEQADELGDKVVPVEVAKPNKPISEMGVKELRPLAKAANIESYSTKTRDELIAALEGLVVATDEPSGD